MAGSLNKVTLIGNLGTDPEIRAMQDGGKVANLSIATTESWKDKMTGERKDKTEWHRIVIFNDKLVEVAEKYLKKGMKVYIEGQLQTRKWTDASGMDKYTTEVVLQRFRGELVMLDSRNASNDNDSNIDSNIDNGSQNIHNGFPADVTTATSTPSGNAAVAMNVDNNPIDDEIPF